MPGGVFAEVDGQFTATRIVQFWGGFLFLYVLLLAADLTVWMGRSLLKRTFRICTVCPKAEQGEILWDRAGSSFGKPCLIFLLNILPHIQTLHTNRSMHSYDEFAYFPSCLAAQKTVVAWF
jgi:hypothetical protein